jgi:uncharacterized protein RhaS with RHS repeats
LVEIEYDVLARKKSTRVPDLGYWQYGYNGFGEPISQTDGKGKVTTMTWIRCERHFLLRVGLDCR